MSEPPSSPFSSPPRRYESARERLRRRILGDWRGCEQPRDLRRHERMAADLVRHVLARAGLGNRIMEEEMAKEWAGMVGEFLARHSRPVALRNGVLQVAVMQSAVRYDLERNLKRDVLAKLQKRYGPGVVKDLRFTPG